MQVLFVCTANRCRSPWAEAVTNRIALGHDLDWTATSAGRLDDGNPVPADGIELSREFAIDLQQHRSRHLTPDLVDSADLIVGMAKEHARDVVALVPDARPRTFTWADLVESVAEHPPTGDVREWAASVPRPAGHLLGRDPRDVEDPIGRPVDVWRRMALRLEHEAATIITAFDQA